MKLKMIRYFGKFYECDGHLGWLPMHQAIVAMIVGLPEGIEWVPQKMVKFY